jgi:hypothetical protein
MRRSGRPFLRALTRRVGVGAGRPPGADGPEAREAAPTDFRTTER